MTHPGDEGLRRLEAAEERTGVAAHLHFGASILPTLRWDHLAAIQVCDEVHAVADAEHRCDLEGGRLRRRDVLAVNRVWTTAEDDAGRRPLPNPFDGPRRRMDLRVDPRLADAARDQLSVL